MNYVKFLQRRPHRAFHFVICSYFPVAAAAHGPLGNESRGPWAAIGGRSSNH